MPEGPEIKREADKIAAAMLDKPIEEVYFAHTGLKKFSAALRGSMVETVSSRSKAMLIRFNCDLTLYSHNQLYGRWFVKPRGEFPKTNRSLRVALHGPDMSALLYSASDIAVLTPEQLLEHPYLKNLGPEPLDESLDWQDFAARLNEPKFARRTLGSLFLDQRFIAGIGNYLRSEILFRARLTPARHAGQLTRSEVNRLARATVSITRRAYATGGVTNPATRVNTLKREGAKRSTYRFAVFGRESGSCYECGSKIERVEFSGRRLYLCRRCQQ